MISVIVMKASQDEQQNQTTITTNINYIQKLYLNLEKNLKLRSKKSVR